MKDYEAAWNALETQEKAINEELQQPGISPEKRSMLEAEKRKVEICKKELIHEFKDEGGQRDITEENKYTNAQKPSETNERNTESNDLEQLQKRQIEQAKEHQRDLIIRKYQERQRS